MTGANLLGEPAPTLLPPDPAAAELEAGGSGDAYGRPTEDAQPDLERIAAAHPTSSLAWAVLAERALGEGRAVEGYAYARTGYHRGLDALRRAGWRGHGAVPWEHEPNRGFLRALAALGRAAAAIGEVDEVERIGQFLTDASPAAAEALRPASPER